MDEEKPETLDFVKDFQEYLSQQTQHVNMISGSVSGVKDTDDIPEDLGQNGLEHPAVDMSLDDGSSMLVDGFERTYDGKLKCRYCNYATRGTARLIEHIRIHTGEKPHRCHLCPFASAYERHLEAHMRSHTGEKPYKCELCSFRCSDRSNLSHHRRRRHKLLPMKGARSALSHRKMLSVLQKRGSSLAYSRRVLVNINPMSMVLQKPNAEQHHLGNFSHDLPSHPHLHQEPFDSLGKDPQVAAGGGGSGSREEHELVLENPLNQLSTLAGQLSSLPPDSQGAPVSPGAESLPDEKPTYLVQQPVTAPAAVSASVAQASSPITPEPRPAAHSGFSPGAGPCSERTSSPSGTNSQPATPTPTPAHPHDPQLLHHCPHCHIYFPDNILYTIHMGCHGYENPFQCNICGHRCRNKYDFACHFARGQHKNE